MLTQHAITVQKPTMGLKNRVGGTGASQAGYQSGPLRTNMRNSNISVRYQAVSGMSGTNGKYQDLKMSMKAPHSSKLNHLSAHASSFNGASNVADYASGPGKRAYNQYKNVVSMSMNGGSSSNAD